MTQAAEIEFNIQIGDSLTHNVEPLLHEIRHGLIRLRDDNESSMIDLRALPLAPGEEDELIRALGEGEIHARLNALGPSEISETAFSGVWLVSHFNEAGSIVGRFIEITRIPEILISPDEEILEGLSRLEQTLDSNASGEHS